MTMIRHRQRLCISVLAAVLSLVWLAVAWRMHIVAQKQGKTRVAEARFVIENAPKSALPKTVPPPLMGNIEGLIADLELTSRLREMNAIPLLTGNQTGIELRLEKLTEGEVVIIAVKLDELHVQVVNWTLTRRFERRDLLDFELTLSN